MGTTGAPSTDHAELCHLLLSPEQSLTHELFAPTANKYVFNATLTGTPSVYDGPEDDAAPWTDCYVSRYMVFEKREVKNNRVRVVPRPDMLVTWPGDWGEERWIHKDALLELDAPRFDVEAVREAIAEGRHRHGMYACFYALDGACRVKKRSLVVLRGPTFKAPAQSTAKHRVPVLDKEDSKYVYVVERERAKAHIEPVEGSCIRLKKVFDKTAAPSYNFPIRAPIDFKGARPRTTLRTSGAPRVVHTAPSHTAEVLGLILKDTEYEVFGDYIHSSCHESEHLPWLLVRAVIHTSKGDSETKLGGYILAAGYSLDQRQKLEEAGLKVATSRVHNQSDSKHLSLCEPAAAGQSEAHAMRSLLTRWKLLPNGFGPTAHVLHAVPVDIPSTFETSTSNDNVPSTLIRDTCFEVKERRDGKLRVRPRCDSPAWAEDLWVSEGAVLEIDAPRYDVEAVREAIGLGLHKLGMYSCFYAIDEGGARTLIVLLGPTLKAPDSRAIQRMPLFNKGIQVKESETCVGFKVLPLLERVEEEADVKLASRRRSFKWRLQSRCLLDGGAVRLTGAAYTVPMRAPTEEWVCGPLATLTGQRLYGIPRILYSAPASTAEMVGVVPAGAQFVVMGPVVDAMRFGEGSSGKEEKALWLRASADIWCDQRKDPMANLLKHDGQPELCKGVLKGFVLACDFDEQSWRPLRWGMTTTRDMLDTENYMLGDELLPLGPGL